MNDTTQTKHKIDWDLVVLGMFVIGFTWAAISLVGEVQPKPATWLDVIASWVLLMIALHCAYRSGWKRGRRS